jgi:hypothetical protein
MILTVLLPPLEIETEEDDDDDADVVTDSPTERGDDSGVETGSPVKKIVRHYDGVNPEVEAELAKVIEEMQGKGIEKIEVV